MPEHGRDFPDKARHPSRQVHRGSFGYSGFALPSVGGLLNYLNRSEDRGQEFENGRDDVEVDTSGVEGAD